MTSGNSTHLDGHTNTKPCWGLQIHITLEAVSLNYLVGDYQLFLFCLLLFLCSFFCFTSTKMHFRNTFLLSSTCHFRVPSLHFPPHLPHRSPDPKDKEHAQHSTHRSIVTLMHWQHAQGCVRFYHYAVNSWDLAPNRYFKHDGWKQEEESKKNKNYLYLKM